MPKYWLDHVHLISPDPIKTAEYYEKMFGAKRGNVENRPDGRTAVNLDLNGLLIKVMSTRPQPLVPGGSPAGLEHFGLATDNLEATVKEMKANGVKFAQDIREVHPGLKMAFCVAPENSVIELMEESK